MLPLGYSFNLDGTMMYCTFASIFIAQTYHIEMSLGTQIAMLATLMITSKGIAGVPRASLVVIASTLSHSAFPKPVSCDHGHRHLPRHGPQRHQRDRQLARHRGGGEVGGRACAEHAIGPGDVVPPDMIPGEMPAMAGHRGCEHAPTVRVARGRRAVAGGVPAGHWQRADNGAAQSDACRHQEHACRASRLSRSSPPFSFLDQANRPIGYSLELCEAVVDEIGAEIDEPDLKIEYVKVTSDDRIPAVVENKIDLECGSTTANAERAKQVAFSPLMFVAGTKLMVPKASTDLGANGPQGQDHRRHQGHDQRAGDARGRQEFGLGLKIVTATTTSSPTRCWPTARPTRSPPTTSCFTA